MTHHRSLFVSLNSCRSSFTRRIKMIRFYQYSYLSIFYLQMVIESIGKLRRLSCCRLMKQQKLMNANAVNDMKFCLSSFYSTSTHVKDINSARGKSWKVKSNLRKWILLTRVCHSPSYSKHVAWWDVTVKFPRKEIQSTCVFGLSSSLILRFIFSANGNLS